MNRALFDLDADGEDQQFVATHATEVTATLRVPSTASSWMLQVWDPDQEDASQSISANPPRASKGAPLLTLVGTTSGQHVAAASPSAEITFTPPAAPGTHSWIVRSIVDGGLTNGLPDPEKIHERGLVVLDAGSVRKPVATETQQFEDEGWAGLICDLIDNINEA